MELGPGYSGFGHLGRGWIDSDIGDVPVGQEELKMQRAPGRTYLAHPHLLPPSERGFAIMNWSVVDLSPLAKPLKLSINGQ